jgi:lysyl-tRNA synthetase class 2
MNNDWKPLCSLQVIKQRAFLLSKIREYFASQDVLEVETPILSSAGNTDININSFSAEKIKMDAEKSYLRTSPEFPLKRLLCSGIGDIFEIGKVFRKGEVSKTHNVEFSMLEWYKLNYDYHQLIQDVTRLLSYLFESFELSFNRINILSYNEAFIKYLKLDINHTSLYKINSICRDNGYSGSPLTVDESLDFLFATQIQPELDKKQLTFITLYPISQAALSQINPDDNSTSLRFEVFFGGHELGNGYQELTNSDELLKRFEQDNKYRLAHNLPLITIDNHLISAMKKNMPNCSGIAMGLDRLLMILLGCKNISNVLTFNAENS